MRLLQVNNILQSMQGAVRTLEAENASEAERSEALFTLALEGYAVMKLVNAEIAAHGDENQGLIGFTLSRCRNMGVDIRLAPDRELYFYDFEAFHTYLRENPEGPHAAEARFALIEKAFYDYSAGTRTAGILLGHLEQKKRFLQDYPDFQRGADVEMFIALDYLEMSSLLEEDEQTAESAEYRELALNQCRQIIQKYSDSEAAAFARDLLLRLGM